MVVDVAGPARRRAADARRRDGRGIGAAPCNFSDAARRTPIVQRSLLAGANRREPFDSGVARDSRYRR